MERLLQKVNQKGDSMARSKQENVPQTMRLLFEDIVRRTDAFCREYLNDEYARLACDMAAALARKRPSPLTQGKVEGWACGIIYALGSINFLFDPSQTPHMKASELCERFGVSTSTGSSRSRKIQDVLKITMLDPKWTLPSMLEENPMAWYIQVNGIMVDARRQPREIQEEAFRLGLIPYVPGRKGTPSGENMMSEPRASAGGPNVGKQPRRYNVFVNPYPDVDLATCPNCGGPTEERKLPLVVGIEGEMPLVVTLNMTCRYCPTCELLIVQQDDLEALMTAYCEDQAPEVMGNEYLLLGTVDTPVWERGAEGTLTPEDLVDHLHDFKDVWTFEPSS
jgi:hypothetical protein